MSTNAVIGQALKLVLTEQRFSDLLKANHINDYEIHIPQDWNEPEIIKGILSRLDIADLAIVNLTPKTGYNGTPSPNVYYELGLLHSLGMPVIPIYENKTPIPFYMLTHRGYGVAEFSTEAVANALRAPLEKFLDPDDGIDFADNRITQFYDGLPIVDISAAVGLATGYYYNFVGRLLREGSFVSHYPGKIKKLIIARPLDIMNTYEQDRLYLRDVLSRAGFSLATEKLDAPPGDDKGPVWIDHVNGTVIDLPRTIYPLKISPKLLSMQERMDKMAYSPTRETKRNLFLKQTGERLLDKVEQTILYHIRKEREGYRRNLLHFSTIDDIPKMLK